MENNDWTQALQPLLVLALQFEDEGQYSLAKLARATVDALGRRAAYDHRLQRDRQGLVNEIFTVAETLSTLDVNPDLPAALRQGANVLAEGRLPRITDTPHPYVCRTCGHLALGEAPAKCPTCGAWAETFQWFAPIYWLDALDPPAALSTLRRLPQELTALLTALPEQAMTRRPEDGGWDIHNIVTHLRDAQGVLDYRLELFMNEEHPALESKAVFEWATRADEHPPSTLEIFEEYQNVRARLLTRLEALPILDWWRTGYHEEFGVVSIKQQVSYFASHELTHLPQLEKLRPPAAP